MGWGKELRRSERVQALISLEHKICPPRESMLQNVQKTKIPLHRKVTRDILYAMGIKRSSETEWEE